MRGATEQQSGISFYFSAERKIPTTHPLRAIKARADAALAQMSPLFDRMYADTGRASVPPERLLKSTLLMALYTIRSERKLCEELEYNFLYRWFLDMDTAEAVFDHSTFSANRRRLIEHEAAERFFEEIVRTARAENLLSDEHFSVDGTLIEAWASMKSVRPKDEKPEDRPKGDGGRNGWVNFKGEKRSNDTHASTTDPDAKLLRKSSGQATKLCYTGHALMDNRHGLLRDFFITPSVGITESEGAAAMLAGAGIGGEGSEPTVAADKGYDNQSFVQECRDLNIKPHVARKKKGTALDDATVSTIGYAISQRVRKRIEEIFGWMKTIGGLRKTRFVGVEKTNVAGLMVGAAYNLMRIAKLADRRVEADVGAPPMTAAA